ncbi:CHASE2 domain-containing protein [Variovorax fucosicus]|uniref:CHASE2 domain-containing protein n=1 Tax=Variovorax fucosicus TaxID=3053517 RepID=UPI002575955C|nr:CHASE2 domain-containing protein [Variovorax sp. J22G47]MDM0055380.1 CHASE2 domain-containing protein [Variovorax sp. J22G47]
MSRCVRHRLARRLEWVVVAAIALALVVGMDVSGMLRQPNRLVQDAIVAAQGRDVRDSDVVIVAIDEKSMAALGRWPWRRKLHAQLIDRITQDGPRAIGLDLLLTEEDIQHPDDDAALASALERSGKVVLPMMMHNHGGSPMTMAPTVSLAAAANRLGFDHLSVDNDGIARNVYLREGPRGAQQDHFSLAMLRIGEPDRSVADVPGNPDDEKLIPTPPSSEWLDWRRSHKMVLPFAGPSGHFPRISYVDALKGEVPAGTFRGKYVLVGTTAAGLGSQYATPVASQEQLMPGIEITANVLDSLLRRYEVTPTPTWLNAGLNALVVLLALIGMTLVGPLAALLLTGALALWLWLATFVGGAMLHQQFAPLAGMLGLGIAYALWGWGRLSAASRYLIEASTHLRASANLGQAPSGGKRSSGDFLDRRIKALEKTTWQLRDLHRFVSDSLDNLPDATLVCDRSGKLLLANAAATRYFNVPGGDWSGDASVVDLMRYVRSNDDHHQLVVTPESLAQAPASRATAARDIPGRDLLVKQAPSFSADGQHAGWIVSIVDVTEMRELQRQRDDAMHFLSHDIRAPHTSILTLLALDRHDPTAMTPQQFHDRIERHARKALALSDGFIQLARARSQRYRFEPCCLADMLRECIDDAWETRQRNKIEVTLAPGPQEALSHVDRELVGRALDNLLGNALKYAPEGSTVTCAVEPHADGWALRVEDEGPGIAEDQQAAVFEPFLKGASMTRTDGAGLGLAFVKTVAVRHGGKVLLESTAGRGATFQLVLPRDIVADAC